MATARSYRNGIWFAELALTVQAAEYAAADIAGGKLSFTSFGEAAVGGAGGIIESVMITDLAKQSTNKDIVFFDTDPSNSTFTENGAVTVHDTDILNIIGVAQVTTWVALADSSVGQVLNLNMPFVLSTGTTLFAIMIERGTPTYAGTGDVTIRLGVRPL